MTAHPLPWSCQMCGATDDFVCTIDRLMHAVPGHCSIVVDRDGNRIDPSEIRR